MEREELLSASWQVVSSLNLYTNEEIHGYQDNNEKAIKAFLEKKVVCMIL